MSCSQTPTSVQNTPSIPTGSPEPSLPISEQSWGHSSLQQERTSTRTAQTLPLPMCAECLAEALSPGAAQLNYKATTYADRLGSLKSQLTMTNNTVRHVPGVRFTLSHREFLHFHYTFMSASISFSSCRSDSSIFVQHSYDKQHVSLVKDTKNPSPILFQMLQNPVVPKACSFQASSMQLLDLQLTSSQPLVESFVHI